jgi:hypothetical protein
LLPVEEAVALLDSSIGILEDAFESANYARTESRLQWLGAQSKRRLLEEIDRSDGE